MHEKGGLVMVKQFKETQMEGRRLLHVVIAACMPVSYTHLDVYKRQVQSLVWYRLTPVISRLILKP